MFLERIGCRCHNTVPWEQTNLGPVIYFPTQLMDPHAILFCVVVAGVGRTLMPCHFRPLHVRLFSRSYEGMVLYINGVETGTWHALAKGPSWTHQASCPLCPCKMTNLISEFMKHKINIREFDTQLFTISLIRCSLGRNYTNEGSKCYHYPPLRPLNGPMFPPLYVHLTWGQLVLAWEKNLQISLSIRYVQYHQRKSWSKSTLHRISYSLYCL